MRVQPARGRRGGGDGKAQLGRGGDNALTNHLLPGNVSYDDGNMHFRQTKATQQLRAEKTRNAAHRDLVLTKEVSSVPPKP